MESVPPPVSDQLQLHLGSGWQPQPGPEGGHHVLREHKDAWMQSCSRAGTGTHSTKSTGICRASQALELNYMFCI